MLENVRYVNSQGAELVFGENGIYVNENDLRDWEWSFSTEYGKISNFKRKASTKTLPVQIWAESEEKGTEIRNRLHDLALVDISAGKPGRLYVGDCYLLCYITGSKKSGYLTSKRMMSVSLTISTSEDVWYQERVLWFGKKQDTQLATVGNALVGFAEVGAGKTEETAYNHYLIEGETIKPGDGTISGLGMMDGKVMLDGSSDEQWFQYSNETVQTASSVFYITFDDSAIGMDLSFCSSFENTKKSTYNSWHTASDGKTMIYTDHPDLARKYFRWGAPDATVADFRAYLAENPITLWYKKATHNQGDPYYAPFFWTEEGVFHAQGVELTAPLYAGDTLETNVNESNIETHRKKVLVLDGIDTPFTSFSAGNYAMRTLPDLKPNGEVVCSHLPSDTEAGVWLGTSGVAFMLAGMPDNVTDIALANAWLAEQYTAGTPVTIVYELATPQIYTHNGPVNIGPAGTNSYDYGYPYGYDEAGNVRITQMVNESLTPCAFRLEIPGHADNPEIVVGNDLHKVHYSIQAGQTLVVDSRDRVIKAVTPSGSEFNLFRYRDKTDDIFAAIPIGASDITWNGDFVFSLTLYKERSEPLWT